MFEVSGALVAILVAVVLVGLYSGPRPNNSNVRQDRAILPSENNKTRPSSPSDVQKQKVSAPEQILSPRDKAATIGATVGSHFG